MEKKCRLVFGPECIDLSNRTGALVQLAQTMHRVQIFHLLNGRDENVLWPAYFRQPFMEKRTETTRVSPEGSMGGGILLYQDDILALLRNTVSWRQAVQEYGRENDLVLVSGLQLPPEGKTISHLGELDSLFRNATMPEYLSSQQIEQIFTHQQCRGQLNNQRGKKRRPPHQDPGISHAYGIDPEGIDFFDGDK